MCSRTLWRRVLFQDLWLATRFSVTSSVLLAFAGHKGVVVKSDNRGGERMFRNVRAQCIDCAEGSSAGSSKTEPLFPPLNKE